MAVTRKARGHLPSNRAGKSSATRGQSASEKQRRSGKMTTRLSSATIISLSSDEGTIEADHSNLNDVRVQKSPPKRKPGRPRKFVNNTIEPPDTPASPIIARPRRTQRIATELPETPAIHLEVARTGGALADGTLLEENTAHWRFNSVSGMISIKHPIMPLRVMPPLGFLAVLIAYIVEGKDQNMRCSADEPAQNDSDLHDIGLKQAADNFEKLKRHAEERAKAATQLIAVMKAELATQTAVASEAQALRLELESTMSDSALLEKQNASLAEALEHARTENRSLSSRLAADRLAAHASRAMGNVGKAAKTGQQATKQADMLRDAHAKEDLYADLTGLIVRDVKSGGEETLYDCIQTGQNGTLHFKLGLSLPSGNDGGNVCFTYRPQLDPNRDRLLLDTLPDYLVEDITFPASHAAKFYARVAKALTEQEPK